MNPAAKMKARVTEIRDPARAEIERNQRATEKRMANLAAARLQKMNGFKMPPLPERPLELIELSERRTKLGDDRKTIETELRQMEVNLWQEQNGDVDPLDQAAERIAAGAVAVTALDAIPEAIEPLRIRLDLAKRAEGKLVVQIAEGNAAHRGSKFLSLGGILAVPPQSRRNSRPRGSLTCFVSQGSSEV